MTEACFELYRGYPEDAGDTLKKMIEKGQLSFIAPGADGTYRLFPGIYSCHIFGEGIYDTLKVFCVREAQEGIGLEKEFGQLALPVKKRDDGYAGYQPAVVPIGAPEYFKRTQHDEMLCIWPDEVLKQYGAAEVPEDHQFITQEEMEQRLGSATERCSYLHTYTIGKTKAYGFAFPMVIFTKEEIDERMPWEGVLQRLGTGEKLNLWYQAQIHGNEPASCGGALEIIDYFSRGKQVEELLDHCNLVVFPRTNPEGAYLYRRMAYVPVNLNRDHLAADAYETQLLHRGFSLLLPEVVLDCHECKFYLAETTDGNGYVMRGGEVFTTPASSLNIAEKLREKSYALCGRVFEEMRDAGWDINHFGVSENNTLGRVFYGLHQSLSFLIETRGIGGGRFGYERRTRAQKEIVLSYIKNILADSSAIKEAVRMARADMTHRERMVLHHGASGDICLPYHGVKRQYRFDGSLYKEEPEYLQLHDLPLRERAYAEGYIIPAEMEQITEILDKVRGIGVMPAWLEPGTCMDVQQYICLGLREGAKQERDIAADFWPQETVVFPEGAYFIQGEGAFRAPLAMLLEPDVTDSASAKGTLYQQGLLDYDAETGLFPLYRVI